MIVFRKRLRSGRGVFEFNQIIKNRRIGKNCNERQKTKRMFLRIESRKTLLERIILVKYFFTKPSHSKRILIESVFFKLNETFQVFEKKFSFSFQ